MIDREFVRPRLVLSRCLELDACRYNGHVIRADIVRRLKPHVELVPTCPEVEIGLGVPRPPIRLVSIDGATHVRQPETGRDLTEAMTRFADAFLDGLDGVDGFLLKSRSPSCGLSGVKVYGAKGAPLRTEAGLFAARVRARFPHHAVEDEGRLTNLALRDAFLTRLFAFAGLRELATAGTTGALVAFHASHKLTLLAHSPAAMRELGRLVANPGDRPSRRLIADYDIDFRRALGRPATRGRHVDALTHAVGYFKHELSAREKRHFALVRDAYAEGRVPRAVPLTLVQSWIERFEEPYLAGQSYFAPYPADLLDPSDSGRETL